MRHAFPLLLALATAVIPAPVLAERIACEPPFGPDASHDGLVRTFGAGNVRFEEALEGPEAEPFAASIVFPDDPARRLEVIWLEAETRSGIANVTIGEGSAWTFDERLKVGQSLVEVEVANGRAFDLNGFGWDYGGAVVDWKGGTLGSQPAGCRLGVFFFPAPDAAPAAVDDVSGDRLFSSSDPKIRSVSPTVMQIYFGYSE
jgi:hypothetical protein